MCVHVRGLLRAVSAWAAQATVVACTSSSTATDSTGCMNAVTSTSHGWAACTAGGFCAAGRTEEPPVGSWIKLTLAPDQTIDRMVASNYGRAKYGCRSCTKDLKVEFSDGSTATVTLDRLNEGSFQLVPVATSFVKITVMSAYGAFNTGLGYVYFGVAGGVPKQRLQPPCSGMPPPSMAT